MANERLWGPFVIEKGDTNFVRTVRDNLNAINGFPLGQKLFAAITKEGITCKIEYLQNTFNVKDYFRHPFGSSSATIFCDPHYLLTKNFEPTIKTVRQKRKTFIYYYHEIIHCLHVVSNYWAPAWDAEEEFRTVGLYSHEGGRFTENAFRKILGLPRRPVYTWIGSKTRIPEMQKRRLYGLPPKPRDYIKGVEDDFKKWEQWKVQMRMKAFRIRGQRAPVRRLRP